MFDPEEIAPREAADPAPRGDVAFPRAGSAVDARFALLWASRSDHHAVAWARAQRTQAPVATVQELFLAADPGALAPDAALDALVAVQEHRARLDALEAELLVRAAGATQVVRDVLIEGTDPATGLPVHGREPRSISFIDEVIDEIACALHRPLGVVQQQIHVARLLHGPLARTRAMLAAGRITYVHAAAICEQAFRLASGPLGVDPDGDLVFAAACDELQDRVLPHVAAETSVECRARARRVVVSIDPAGAAARRRRARVHCGVTARALDDGLALVEAVLPALEAAAVIARIDAEALAAVTTGEVDHLGLGCDPSIGQVRAAVFARLIRDAGQGGDGADTGPSLTVEVGVLVDAATLTGLTPDGPVWVAVAGQRADACRADLLELLGRPGVDASFRRLVTDPATGALVDRGARSYRATAALRAWLEARDQRCTHPGCTRPARRCDVDHAVDFHEGGPTTRANARLRCRRHHNAKTHGNWQVHGAADDGSYDLISPAGRHYRHAPEPVVEPIAPGPPGAPSGTSPPADDPPF